MPQQQDNKRVAKNTLMLYLRQLLVMAVALYTSRVVLDVLGISDYGLYNVVGGFVTMIAYMNTVFSAATQRFLSFYLGKKDPEKVKIVFRTAVSIHIILAIIILIIAETFGLWFVNNKLEIDPTRILAANYVYQCALLVLMFTIINIPFNACIISHEYMGVYAYVSIYEAVMKLAMVFLLTIIPFDKLIIYALLQVLIVVSIRVFYTIYCKKKFEECSSYKFLMDKGLFREMFSFSGWTFVGTLGFTFKDQFSNIMLNMFYGTVINAARGVASQVNGYVTSFAVNFCTALNPQITKQYAEGDGTRSQNLVYSGAKFAFFLMAFFAIPIIVNIDSILQLWLVDVPEYTSLFLIIALIAATINTLSSSITTAIQATGNIKVFQIGISIIMLLELPIGYLLLKAGYPPYYVVLPAILTNIAGVVFRFVVLKKQIPEYSYKIYFIGICLKCLVIFIITLFLCNEINKLLSDSFVMMLINIMIDITITFIAIYLFGLSQHEKTIIISFVTNRINHTKNA